MSDFKVTTEELDGAQRELTDLAGEIQSGLRELAGEVEALLAGGWSGSAASAFEVGWRDWQEGGRLVLDGLGRAAALLAVSAREYDAADGSAASGLDRLNWA